MSGRAGRRGKDDKGIVIMMVDEKLNTPVVKNLVQVNITWLAVECSRHWLRFGGCSDENNY